MTTRVEKDARRKAAIDGTGEKVIKARRHLPRRGAQEPMKPPRRLHPNTRLEVVNGVTYEAARFGGYRDGFGQIVKVFRRTAEGQGLQLCSARERNAVLAFISHLSEEKPHGSPNDHDAEGGSPEAAHSLP